MYGHGRMLILTKFTRKPRTHFFLPHFSIKYSVRKWLSHLHLNKNAILCSQWYATSPDNSKKRFCFLELHSARARTACWHSLFQLILTTHNTK